MGCFCAEIWEDNSIWRAAFIRIADHSWCNRRYLVPALPDQTDGADFLGGVCKMVGGKWLKHSISHFDDACEFRGGRTRAYFNDGNCGWYKKADGASCDSVVGFSDVSKRSCGLSFLSAANASGMSWPSDCRLKKWSFEIEICGRGTRVGYFECSDILQSWVFVENAAVYKCRLLYVHSKNSTISCERRLAKLVRFLLAICY